jgi:hypothetical protein
MYGENIELNTILEDIKQSMDLGYELEFSIDYNRELKDLPENKFYKNEEVLTIDYMEFISRIYNHFRRIERQELYEFQVRVRKIEDETNFNYELCALRPFSGHAGYKYGGGSGTFAVRIFLTNRNLLLEQLINLNLPEKYHQIGIDFIKEIHPYHLNDISSVIEHIKSYIYKTCIDKLMDKFEYKLRERIMKFEELRKLVVDNLIFNQFVIDDFEITIKECYDDFYFEMNNKHLGNIVKLTQRKEVQIDYYLDIECR